MMVTALNGASAEVLPKVVDRRFDQAAFLT